MVDLIAANPEAGSIMPGCGSSEVPTFLLTVFGKGEKASLSQSERNALATMTKKLPIA